MTRTLMLTVVMTCYAMTAITEIVIAADEPAPAAEAPKTEAPPAETPATDEPKTEATPAAEPPVDPYAVPEEGSPEELLTFIKDLAKVKPKSMKMQDQILHLRQSSAAAVGAADKVLDTETDGKTRLAAIDAKILALGSLSRIDPHGAEEQLAALGEKIKDEKDEAVPELAGRARWIPFQLRAYKVMRGDAEGPKPLLADMQQALADSPDPMAAVQIAMILPAMLEANGGIDKATIQTYRDIADALAKLESPMAARGAKMIEGVVRKLELLGNPITLTGTLLGGETFDQSTLKGKVVLVDFWATWCGPCRGELPNVQKCYEQYHEKGFDVVGISLDTDREQLEQFIKDQEIPWPILFEEKEEDQGWKHPIAKTYGVNGIPAMFLIGADGNVISLSARGKRLVEILEQQLGAPATTETDPEAKTPDEKPAT